MKQAVRPSSKKLEITTYARDKVLTFQVKHSSPQQGTEVEAVEVPVPLIYRLYHLGRAYDLHQLANLQPRGVSAFDSLATQFLIMELEQITSLVDDPALKHYVAPLTALLKASRPFPGAYVTASE